MKDCRIFRENTVCIVSFTVVIGGEWGSCLLMRGKAGCKCALCKTEWLAWKVCTYVCTSICGLYTAESEDGRIRRCTSQTVFLRKRCSLHKPPKGSVSIRRLKLKNLRSEASLVMLGYCLLEYFSKLELQHFC
jgi:hypothetical protein